MSVTVGIIPGIIKFHGKKKNAFPLDDVTKHILCMKFRRKVLPSLFSTLHAKRLFSAKLPLRLPEAKFKETQSSLIKL